MVEAEDMEASAYLRHDPRYVGHQGKHERGLEVMKGKQGGIREK